MKVADALDELAELVRNDTLADDLVLAMGAGDVNSLWQRLVRSEQPNQATTAVSV